MGDHTETIQIDFDPKVLPLETLLVSFWEAISPTSAPYSLQVTITLPNFWFWLFLVSICSVLSDRWGKADLWKISSWSTKEIPRPNQDTHPPCYPYVFAHKFDDPHLWLDFTLAEDYHQKYYLRGKRKFFDSLNMTDQDVINSTLACHLNAVIHGR